MNVMSTAIQIRRPDVVEDARKLAALRGLSLTDAIGGALRKEVVEAERAAKEARDARFREAMKIVDEAQKLPIVGPLLTNADLYDEDGMPKSLPE